MFVKAVLSVSMSENYISKTLVFEILKQDEEHWLREVIEATLKLIYFTVSAMDSLSFLLYRFGHFAKSPKLPACFAG